MQTVLSSYPVLRTCSVETAQERPDIEGDLPVDFSLDRKVTTILVRLHQKWKGRCQIDKLQAWPDVKRNLARWLETTGPGTYVSIERR